MIKEVPYWRLSSFYLFYFATLGIVVPYFSLYLESIGYVAEQIGIIFFFLNITKVVAPFVWGAIADKTGKRINIIRTAAFISMIVFIGVLPKFGFIWMAVVTVTYSFFWNAALPQFEALTLNHLEKNSNKYTQIRLWGSVGFILTVVGVGQLIDIHSVNIVPYAAIIGYIGIFTTTLFASEKGQVVAVECNEPIIGIIKKPFIIAFFIAGFLLQFSHGPFYAFFTIYLGENGYGSDTIGYLWAVGVVAEIILFLFVQILIPKFGARKLLIFVLIAATLRWGITAYFPQILPLIVIAQILHMATFGISHAVAMYTIHRFFCGKVQGRGQALYTSICMGAGTGAGSYFSGFLWEKVGGTNVYTLSALATFIAFFIVWKWFRPEEG